ncbi:longitudinals lacking protein-like [Pollicipes pollicipes]|uniref:longitudinals lacking protein-like n=1 Tax=Pollicipes pollicipes TaxID=41117 RepID=UPI00188502CC|nr:longitudinals lacking protein-like [Pollicipes pollicipes]
MGSQLLLRWDNHLPSFACSMKECLDDGDLTDLTISCQGRVLHCHRLVLSVASPHFKQLLKANPGQHPIVIMRDIPYKDIAALLTFIYQGEVTVTEEDLPSFLKTAKALEVRGLADDAHTGGTSSRPEPRRASHLEPEVVVKEEPCDPDEAPAARHPVAMTTINDLSLLQHGFRAGSSFVEVGPARVPPKSE